MTDYVLARDEREYERLRTQARMLEPATARLLDRASPPAGARCLDVGCGPGEVMRVMAERVGPGGVVTGVDVDGRLGAEALETLHALGHTQCRFEALDVETVAAPAGAPFDVVFARALLLHVGDPAAVLRRLWRWVAPGGHLVIQDYDLTMSEVVPELDTIAEFRRVALESFRALGCDLHLGLRLGALHAQAGLGLPDGIDAAACVAPLPELAGMYEEVYRSVLPTALGLGLVTRAQADRWFEAFPRDVARAGAHLALWPLLVGTWKRKD